MANITILGAGGWGLALALSLNTGGHKVTVWSPFEDEVKNLLKNRTNEKLLKGIIMVISSALGGILGVNVAAKRKII